MLDNWMNVFAELLSKIPYETVEKETISHIYYLSAPNQHVYSKYAAVRMIGFIAEVPSQLLQP